MERIINLGGKDYKYNVNFKLSYDLTKYRNRISTGFDITKTNKKIIKEIIEMQNKVAQKQKEIQESGKQLTGLEEFEFVDELSDEAKKFLNESNSDLYSRFNYDEIIEIAKLFTKIDNEEEINKVLDKEIEQNGYDNLITKLINEVAQVFTNAKSN